MAQRKALTDTDALAFERAYAARSAITVEALRQHRRVVPCGCGEDGCEGWGVVPLDSDICGECGQYEWVHPLAECSGFTRERRWPTVKATDIRETHKQCPVPGCFRLIPNAWTFCKGRDCQGRRHLAAEAMAERWRRRDEAEQRARARAAGYIAGWKREQSARLGRLRDLAIINNHRLRQQQLEEAIREGSAELRALIREQHQDERRVSIGERLSLDQPILHDSRRMLADVVVPGESYLLEWHDPTGEVAILHCDEEPNA